MAIARPVLAIDLVQGLLYLGDRLLCAGVQRLLHHRLLGTPRPAHRRLQRRVAAQARVNLHQAVCPRQDRDESIVEFVERRVPYRLLRDMYARPDRREHVALPQQHADPGQARTRREMLCAVCRARLVHGDDPPVGCVRPFLQESLITIWASHLRPPHTATNLD